MTSSSPPSPSRRIRRSPVVAVVSLSPRLGVSFDACEQAARVLTERGATVSFCSTVDMPLVPSGMDDVVGFSYPKEITDVAEVVRSADAVVLGVPVQQSAVSGVARNWVELFRSEIEGKPVLPVVAAGSDRSHLAAVQFQAELFTHFGAAPVKPVVVTSATPLAEILDRLVDATDDLLVHFPAERARIKSAS